jgi:hypothetical protein
MFLGLLTLITALSISAVAIYYSVAGLVAIFAAAALPIMVMGGVLEVSKLVTAVWLHKHWKQATWWLRTYLSLAVVVLMLITSMGIFGYLSKAHIEQTSASEETVARVETIQKEIDRQLGIVGRAENRIRVLESSETNTSSDVQDQIDKEQERIDNAYSRIQPAIDEQNKIIADQTGLYSNELEALDRDFNQLQAWINEGGKDNIAKVQGMVGTTPDGDWGFLTSNAVDKWREANRAKRDELVEKIASISEGNATIEAARAEIARLRKQADDQIASSNKVIERLRDRLADDNKAEDIQKSIDEQNERVRTASSEIDRLTEEKIALESEYRKLEAEVGPIKYIAEFIYGDTADKNMLEEAVRWVIVTIIFVFDPLAVLLLIASQYTFSWRAGNKRKEYEQARAQRIVDNPGFSVNDPKEDKDENSRTETREEAEKDVETLRTGQDEESIQRETSDDQTLARTKESVEDVAKSYITTDDAVGDTVPKADTPVADVPTFGMESTEVQTDEVVEKKDIESSVESNVDAWNKMLQEAEASIAKEEQDRREAELDAMDEDLDWSEAKRKWKDEHPDDNIKAQKKLYIRGHTDHLPWEEYMSEPESYKQNAEQSENSIWQRINKKND